MKLLTAFRLYAEEEVLALGGSLNTYENYRYAAKSFVGEWGNINIEQVTLKMIRRFSLTLQQFRSIGTVRNYIACLRAVLGVCEQNGLEVISAKSVTLPKAKKRLPDCISEEEVERLILAASRPIRGYPAQNRLRNVLIIKMLYVTGLRVSELCSLDKDDIHDREFSVAMSKSKEPRSCYITKEVEELIGDYLSTRNDSNPALFVSAQTGGKRITKGTVELMFRRVRKMAGLESVHPHTMRHSFCTKLLESGVDIRETAELMGHQSWNTTKIYTHITNSRLKNIYDQAMNKV